MMFVAIPKTIKFSDLSREKSLSPYDYREIQFSNPNTRELKELLSEDYTKGIEIGSDSYIHKSNKYFIRTKALQPEFYLPILDDSECAVPMLPQKFLNMNLKKGDILLSKDANIGECGILTEDLPDYMISGGIVRLRIKPELRYYVFAIMKHDFFRDQIHLMVSKGATIKHAKDLWLNALIPFPTQENAKDVISYVSLLTKAIIRKEEEIRKKYYRIIAEIDKELRNNQKNRSFSYSFPRYSDIQNIKRLDTGLYSEKFKEKMFLIENYEFGYNNLPNMGFKIKRGQNLQISAIGESIYSEKPVDDYYKLILPTNISRYGTISKFLWLGNKNELSTLNSGDIIFGAEATLRSYIYISDHSKEKVITNIHGIIFYKENESLAEKIFLKIFFDYLREHGILANIMTGGHGGSLAIKYLKYIKVPNFPAEKIQELSKLYYNHTVYNPANLNLKNLDNEDKRITQQAGIYNLDMQIKIIKKKLDKIITNIALENKIDIDFNFLKEETQNG